MQSTPNVRGEATKVLLRIVAFILYYLLLIILGGLLFVAAFFYTKYSLIDMISDPGSLREIFLLFLSILGIWCLAGMFGLFLIKPLFSFTKNEKPERVEIIREDCPELFSMIYDLADSVKCKRPKHVYLTTDVNACVFYDTSFWSIFFPVKKNLEIGLGLFEGTSTEELKAVLAHEFGHFSQKSMKVGSTVYITNSVLYNLIYAEDWWNRLLDKWQRSDASVFRWFGNITRVITNGIKMLNIIMYRFVQKGYLKLSRQMEFDADNISCSIVGKETFISAMCKVDILSGEDTLYRDCINNLMRENKCVGNYFSGRRIADRLNPDKSIPVLKYDIPMDAPFDTVRFPSRVEVTNVWASHPSLKDRLANAASSDFSSKVVNPTPSWALIPDEMQARVSNTLFALIPRGEDQPVTVISDNEFASWAEKYIRENYIPIESRPFIDRELTSFDRRKLPEVIVSPITEKNALTLSEYETAKKDLKTMQGVLEGKISVKELSYDGIVYKKKQIPIDKHKEYVDGLYRKALKIDAAIYAHLLNCASSDLHQKVIWAYDSLFYVVAFLPELTEMQKMRDAWYKELSRPARRDEDDYSRLCRAIVLFEEDCRGIIKKSNWGLLREVIGKDYENELLTYTAVTHNSLMSINVDEVNKLFQVVDIITNMHKHLYREAQIMIGRVIQRVS